MMGFFKVRSEMTMYMNFTQLLPAVLFQGSLSMLSQSTVSFLHEQDATILTNNATSSLSVPTLHLPGLDSVRHPIVSPFPVH